MDAATPQRWIPPQAETVVALAESLVTAREFPWSESFRRDPALCWFFFIHNADLNLERTIHTLKQGLDPCFFLENVLDYKQSYLADWSKNGALKAYRLSQLAGALAERLAGPFRLDSLLAHCLGQLTQLGSLVQASAVAPLETEKGSDASVYTRKLIRRVTCPAWLRDLLLGLELPSEPNTERWTLLLQLAAGLISQSTTMQSIGRLAAQRLGLSWEDELALATEMSQQWSPPATIPVAGAKELLIRSLRLVHQQPVNTLSFTIRQLEKEVEDLRSRLMRQQYFDGNRLREQKLTAIAELAAGAGHEINNPLAVISGQAQYLLKNEEDLNRARSLERIISQTNRIHHLLRDLMFYARPPEPRYKSQPLGKLLKTTLKMLEELAVSRGVKLELGTAPPKTNITCDIQQVSTALKSLLVNAIEAAPAGGWVKLSAQIIRQRVQFLVEDNGPGIPATAQDFIFDPFYSGRNAGRGVGLGLSKVWRVAQLHGGDVRLAAREGPWTCFILELPVRPVHSQQGSRAQPGTKSRQKRPA